MARSLEFERKLYNDFVKFMETRRVHWNSHTSLTLAPISSYYECQSPVKYIIVRNAEWDDLILNSRNWRLRLAVEDTKKKQREKLWTKKFQLFLNWDWGGRRHIKIKKQKQEENYVNLIYCSGYRGGKQQIEQQVSVGLRAKEKIVVFHNS